MKIVKAALIGSGIALFAMSAFGANTAQHGRMTVPGIPSPSAKLYKLKCMGYAEKVVIFSNFGDGPVPAGTVVKWQTDKTSVEPKSRSGTYTFQQPLLSQASVGINWPPPLPKPGGLSKRRPSGNNNGSGDVPQFLAGLALEFIEPCTFTVQPNMNPAMIPSRARL